MFDAMIFDLDDTLYDYTSLNNKAMSVLQEYTCRRFCVSAETFEEAFTQARKEVKNILGETGASHNRMLYCQKTLEYLGKRPVDEAFNMYEVYWGYILRNMKLREGVKDLFDYCQITGIKIGICTDLTAHIQYRKLRKLGIANYVDAIVTSEEVGAEKPAPAIFQEILKKLQVEPAKALFIGDSLKKDVIGAVEQGMEALWYHHQRDKQYRTISSFYEIKGMVDDGI